MVRSEVSTAAVTLHEQRRVLRRAVLVATFATIVLVIGAAGCIASLLASIPDIASEALRSVLSGAIVMVLVLPGIAVMSVRGSEGEGGRHAGRRRAASASQEMSSAAARAVRLLRGAGCDHHPADAGGHRGICHD